MEKYSLLRRAVEELGPRVARRMAVPHASPDGELLRVHRGEYLDQVVSGALPPSEMRRIGFPWSPELVERSRRSVGATVSAARAALEGGVGVNLAGGTHHAFPDRGEGFCVFNDVAVAIRVLQAEAGVRRAAVLDLDVHQGNGTAAIFRGDSDVFTLSVHGARNFPFRKEASDLDIELPDGTLDGPYLEAVERGVSVAWSSAPQVVFYLAGADPFAGDRLGRLAVSKEGLEERDRIVIEGCRARGIPLVVVMAGGYAREMEDTVAIHLATVRRVLESGPW